ncbi:hypothetical protein [Anabaena azotica]|uniref:Uncharacterized protein n=1 Tax=Anabaena azotica FACHB-119 TaxID=947527 RepID=A0ABR8D5H5_9NOST|nr:hypothetical protein [Anabaena azotica]MBD2501746.1 hypothetical protein [Anabaena azotica FACHB-119]
MNCCGERSPNDFSSSYVSPIFLTPITTLEPLIFVLQQQEAVHQEFWQTYVNRSLQDLLLFELRSDRARDSTMSATEVFLLGV